MPLMNPLEQGKEWCVKNDTNMEFIQNTSDSVNNK